MTDAKLVNEIILAERSYIVLHGGDRFSQPQPNMNNMKQQNLMPVLATAEEAKALPAGCLSNQNADIEKSNQNDQ